jgi:prophage antirepressor-like protein
MTARKFKEIDPVFPEVSMAELHEALSLALGHELETPEARAWVGQEHLPKVRKQGSGNRAGVKRGKYKKREG